MPDRPAHLETRYGHELSPRQREILAMVERGRTNYEIAQALGISPDGVKYHVSEILGKLGVGSREDAAAWWREQRSLQGRLRRGLRVLAPAAAVARLAGLAAVAMGLLAGAMHLATALDRDRESSPGAAGGAPQATTPSTATATSQPSPSAAATATATPAARAVIDWVPFVRWNGVTYLASWYFNPPFEPGAVSRDVLGPEVGRVLFNVSKNVFDLSYRVKDGDAAFLEPGTPLRSVSGFATAFRLGAEGPIGVVVFEADTNPAAARGGDLLDLEGRVQRIAIRDREYPPNELAAIADPAEIAALVSLVLEAPVDQSFRDSVAGESLGIVFELDDGTVAARVFWPSTGELQRGILTPPAFGEAVERALGRR